MKYNPFRNLFALCLVAGANVSAEVRYVDGKSANPTPPFTNWATAATSIQDAVDAAAAGDQILVTNGVYQTGAKWATFGSSGMSNRVLVTKAVTVRSVHGPEATTIVGYQEPGMTNGDSAVRCVFLSNGASLSGFTLTNGATRFIGLPGAGAGGGVFCQSVSEVVSNCVITGNSAAFGGGGSFRGTLNNCVLSQNSAAGGNGGGAYSGRLNNCLLAFNRAYGSGGGAFGYMLDSDGCILKNCTLIGNLAAFGGGASAYFDGPNSGCHLYNCTVTGNTVTGNAGGGVDRCTLNNCIVYFNIPNNYNDFNSAPRFTYSCTTPLPTAGFGNNITNAPLFLDYAGGNLHLQSNSPCINAGNNFYAPASADLDGNPRVAGVNVDIGAYEFQGAGLSDFAGWLWQFGLRIDGSADYSDSDSDLMNNWQEWIAGTVPTDASSALRMLNPANDTSGMLVSWQSVSNRTYFLERATNLGAATSFCLLTSNLIGQLGTTSYTDTNAVGSGSFFYRVGVQ